MTLQRLNFDSLKSRQRREREELSSPISAASLFIEQNWPPKKIQALMGHSSINVTMDVYGHLFESPEEDVALFAKLEEDLLAA